MSLLEADELLQLSEFVNRARLRMDARKESRRARIEARIAAQRSRVNTQMQSVEVNGCQLELPTLAEAGEALSSSARSFLSGDNGKPSELALKLLEHPLTKKIVSNPTVVLMLKLADHAPAIFENGVALVDNVMGVITAMRD